MSEVEGREEAETEETQEEARPKVKMPQASDIRRSDFTPHALGGAKGRPAPRSGTRKAAKRRQIVYTVVVSWSWPRWSPDGLVGQPPAPSVKVKGAFGKAPTVSVPKSKPAAKQ